MSIPYIDEAFSKYVAARQRAAVERARVPFTSRLRHYDAPLSPAQQAIRDRMELVKNWETLSFSKEQQSAIVLFIATGFMSRDMPDEYRREIPMSAKSQNST